MVFRAVWLASCTSCDPIIGYTSPLFAAGVVWATAEVCPCPRPDEATTMVVLVESEEYEAHLMCSSVPSPPVRERRKGPVVPSAEPALVPKPSTQPTTGGAT